MDETNSLAKGLGSSSANPRSSTNAIKDAFRCLPAVLLFSFRGTRFPKLRYASVPSHRGNRL